MKKLIAAAAVLALAIPSVALAAGTLKLSPNPVAPGGVLKMSGKGPKSCKKGKTVTLRSNAFKGTKLPFTLGKVTTMAKKGGKFSAKTTIPANTQAARYLVRAACGGTDFKNEFFNVT